MSRPRLAILAVVATAAAGAPVLQGCAADKVASVDVAKAAQATAAEKTARVAAVLDAKGLGLPQPVQLKLDGVTSLVKPELDLRTDAGPLAQQVMPLVSSLPLELRVRDGVAFLKLPELARTMVPGDKAWASLDVRRLARSLGKDPAGLTAFMRVDSASLLQAMRTAGTLKPVGTETIDGAKTTHLRGTIRLADQIKLLPAKARAAAQRALARIRAKGAGAHLDRAQPFDVWVGDDQLVRRERATITVPAHEGMPAGSITMRVDFSDFGTPLARDTPAVADTFDATPMIARYARAHHRR